MYVICKSMKWTHLPVNGGLYDQHPKLMDDFLVIMAIEANVEERRLAKEKREADRKRRNVSPTGGGRH